jgi:hypothetical protein
MATAAPAPAATQLEDSTRAVVTLNFGLIGMAEAPVARINDDQ